MRRTPWKAGWMLTGAAALAVGEIEPLDGEFLEYLANLEADADNWTLLTEAPDEPRPSRSEPTPSEAEPSASEAEPRKLNQEAADSAVEDR